MRSRRRMAIDTRERGVVRRIDVAIGAHGILMRNPEIGMVEHCT